MKFSQLDFYLGKLLLLYFWNYEHLSPLVLKEDTMKDIFFFFLHITMTQDITYICQIKIWKLEGFSPKHIFSVANN